MDRQNRPPKQRQDNAILRSLKTALLGPQLFAFVPALMLLGYWFGGEVALVFLAVCLPLLVAMVGSITGLGRRAPRPRATDPIIGLPMRDAVIEHLDSAFKNEQKSGLRTVAFAVEIDDFADVFRDHGDRASDLTLRAAAQRLLGALRSGDTLVRLDGARFAVALAPTTRASLETSVQIAARMQTALSEPVQIDGLRLYLTACVGFCMPRRASEKSADSCLEAAEQSLSEAQSNGPGAIRAFTSQQKRKRVVRSGLVAEVETALENGQIVPWFQPQLSTDTGTVSGLEALARWHHPEHGLILPGAFLPAVSAAGLTARLGEVVLFHALSNLRTWDAQGIHVPMIGVNFSSDDLSNPELCDRIGWELDRFDLKPDRLAVEILENVVAEGSNDMITRNIARLAEMGCKIDLDDFGTGHSSIANVRRFNVHRIKIDRTFVQNIDQDRQQQQMLTAILEMANRLQLETLAEGVETMGEHALLSQLGCQHVQGYYIAKPMSAEDTTRWLRLQAETQTAFPDLQKKTGS
jgi:diguanylate cyclase (GGDEF)-like protein